MRTITMYLPQYHRVAENDKWWGEGFTEWTAVKAASPLFEGHKQPRIPLEDNYYNLLEKRTMEWQANLMKQYDIDGQCIYHYYFKDGKKILERPVENLLHWKDIDMPFCFCWANGSWARTWSINGGNAWAEKFEKKRGEEKDNSILLEQKYGREKEWKDHFEYLLPFFEDDRYIKLEGKPVFIFHQIDDIPCLHAMIDYWRDLSISNGFPGIYFIGASSINVQGGLDAILLNAPHMFWNVEKAEREGGISFLAYQETWNKIISEETLDKIKTYFGGVVNYDDSPRKERNAIIYKDFTIELFKQGMIDLYRKSIKLDNEFVFINAWNEWGEGMYLEPDTENGYAYLEAIKQAKKTAMDGNLVPEICSCTNSEVSTEFDWKKSVLRNRKTASCFDYWMTLRQQGKSVCDYLLKYGIKTVAVYGMGRLGKHLLAELEQSEIEVKYIIDRKLEIHHPLFQIKSMNDELETVDAVVITPVWEFDQIYEELKVKINSRFFSIEELIKES